MTDPKLNCDADTIERVFVCDAQKEIARLRAGFEYLKDNFPANTCLQDKCREMLNGHSTEAEVQP